MPVKRVPEKRLLETWVRGSDVWMSVVHTKAKRSEVVAGQATYGMSNLRFQTTGLPFIVFISQRDDARHAARVKWSAGPRVVASEMGSYAIKPFAHKAGPRLAASEEALLQKWIAMNEPILLKYWDGDIAFTEEVIEQLKPV